MTKLLKRIGFALLLAAFLFTAACGAHPLTAPTPAPKPIRTETVAEPLSPDLVYPCQDGSVLSTYKGRSTEDFRLACKHFEDEGYALYSALELGGTLAKTYTNGEKLAHLYYHEHTRELNLVLSENAAATLPPVTPAETEGTFDCTVTQLSQHPVHSNGMGYVIRLTDGSFIVYDGGFTESADELLEILTSSAEGKKPIVRAWVLTHLHNDHYEAFAKVSKKENLSELLTVEHIVYSPIPKSSGGNDPEDSAWRIELFDKASARFEGAKVVYAHTGMVFNFCNLTMEILYTPESLYKNLRAPESFNNSSMVSRLRDENRSMLFTGDLASIGAYMVVKYYGDALQSDMVQMSHHGAESCPISFYEKVQAAVLWYPCSLALYDSSRNADLRRTVAAWESTEEILIAGNGSITKRWQ